MSKRILDGLQKQNRSTQNVLRPKKVARCQQLSTKSSHVVIPVKAAKVTPKPSRDTLDHPQKSAIKFLNNENCWRRKATCNGLLSQSPEKIAIPNPHIEQFQQLFMQHCGKSRDKDQTPGNIEKDMPEAVEPLGLQMYRSNRETKSEKDRGLEVGPQPITASSLEEYCLSGGRMLPPLVEDFIGSVKINRVGDGRGRGLVLSSNVAAGDVLLICNPIAIASKVETEIVESNLTLEAGSYTGSHVLAGQLVEILTQEAWRSSHIRAMLATLCSRGGEELPVPPISLFRQEKIANQTPPRDPVPATTAFPQNEIARLCGIVQCNAFGHTQVTRKNARDITRSWSCGLWMLPSFMNHSCTPSVATVVIGNAMIIVAARDLKCGDELTVAYFDIFRPLQERRASMLHSWNFMCSCPRCALEARMEDALRLVARAYSLRETEAAITVQVQHIAKQQQSQWHKYSSPYSVIDLAQLAEYIENVLFQERGLTRDERNWIRASFLSAYLADGRRLIVDVRGMDEPRRRKHVRKTHIQMALAAAKSVTPGHPQTLQIAAVVLKRTIQAFGKHSLFVDKARKRALAICLRLFGPHREHVLEKIIHAAASDVLSSSVVFLSRP
ncbi:uncharacterized protein [Physcomitrium patens]|uniref:uncharacterized protein n=1 Tax=Physcomitrium patens TaxID=3218 RepID=UPI00024AF7BC